MTVVGTAPTTKGNSIQTMTVTRQDGRWEIAAFQNTRVHYFGRPELLERLTDELRTLL